MSANRHKYQFKLWHYTSVPTYERVLQHDGWQMRFSQTWLRYVWLMAWQIRLSVCRLRAPYSGGLTFRGYFAPYCSLAIRQLTDQKSRRSSKGITPSESVKQEGVVKQVNLAYRRQYLVIYLLYSWRMNK